MELFFDVEGRDLIGIDEVLQMTSGEKKCWNITILDDSISEVRQRSYVGPDVEIFEVHLQPIRASVESAYVIVYITDNDRGKYSSSFH